MTQPTWIDEETSALGAIRQAAALFAAGVRRKVALLLVFSAYAAVLAGAVRWVKYSYAPEYVLRIVEAEQDPSGMPPPRRQLAEYVRTAVFTSQPLVEMMHRYGLYASLPQRNMRAALVAFRSDIDVEVRQNYFVEAREPGAPPRSARLVISYRNADPVLARNVTRDLGELVVAHEQSSRSDQARRAADRAREQLNEAREELAVRRAEVASLTADVDGGAVPPDRFVALIGKLGSLSALEARQDEREKREASLALGAALEERGIGMRFEVVNDASFPSATGATRARVFVAGTAFALGLPLIVIALGAFSFRRSPA